MLSRALGIGVLMGLLAVPAWAQNRARNGEGHSRPRVVVARCLHRMGHATENTVRHMRGATQRCATGIGQLVEEGKTEDAEALAAECAQLVSNQAGRGTTRVESLATHCVEILKQSEDEPENLVELVTQTADQAKTAIANQLTRSLERINEALATE